MPPRRWPEKAIEFRYCLSVYDGLEMQSFPTDGRVLVLRERTSNACLPGLADMRNVVDDTAKDRFLVKRFQKGITESGERPKPRG